IRRAQQNAAVAGFDCSPLDFKHKARELVICADVSCRFAFAVKHAVVDRPDVIDFRLLISRNPFPAGEVFAVEELDRFCLSNYSTEQSGYGEACEREKVLSHDDSLTDVCGNKSNRVNVADSATTDFVRQNSP